VIGCILRGIRWLKQGAIVATFRPDDLKEPALRILATELGVAVAGKSRADIEKEIQQSHPSAALLSVPIVASPTAAGNRLGVAGFLTMATAVITAAIAYANWKSAIASQESAAASQAIVAQTVADKEEEKRSNWQGVKVYEIIDDATKAGDDFAGISFDDIMIRYRSAAQEPEVAIKIGKDELKPFHLRKILSGLRETQIVYRTVDNKYISQRATMNTKTEAITSQITNKVAVAVLKILKDRSGKMTADDLEREVKRQFKNLTDDDYLLAIYQLAGKKTIIIDDQRRVWGFLSPPPLKKNN
jgi:hypothetical protein